MKVKKLASLTLLASASFLNGCQEHNYFGKQDHIKFNVFEKIEKAGAKVEYTTREDQSLPENKNKISITGVTKDNSLFEITFKDQDKDGWFDANEAVAMHKTEQDDIQFESEKRMEADKSQLTEQGITDFLTAPGPNPNFTKEELSVLPITPDVVTQLENAGVRGYRTYFTHRYHGYWSPKCMHRCLSLWGQTKDGFGFVLSFKDKNRDNHFDLEDMTSMRKTASSFLENPKSMIAVKADALQMHAGIQNFLNPPRLNP